MSTVVKMDGDRQPSGRPGVPRNYTAFFVRRTVHDDRADTSSVEADCSASLKMRHLAMQTLTYWSHE
jgi:hypothetical protein